MATTVAMIYFAVMHRQNMEARKCVYHINFRVQDDRFGRLDWTLNTSKCSLSLFLFSISICIYSTLKTTQILRLFSQISKTLPLRVETTAKCGSVSMIKLQIESYRSLPLERKVMLP